MTILEIILFALVAALAAVTQAITGFGFSLLALGAFGWWMDLREASVLLAPVGLAMNVMLFLRLRGHFSWAGIVPLCLAVLAGVPVGALLLWRINLPVLELALAGVMLLSAAQGLRAARTGTPTFWHPVIAGIPCGLAGGLLTGAFGMGGPPVVSFLLNRPLNRFQFIASIQALFALASGVRVTQFVLMGRLDRGDLPVIVPAVAAAAAGVFVGVHLLHRMSEQLGRRIVLWFVVVCGLRYLWAALT
ncbi:MAG: sulfite exporter TauE/SafE family protein [Opitutae bacterium]|nr:sulfite exporter TauE/SafE family protein [Opitutae bacterium]